MIVVPAGEASEPVYNIYSEKAILDEQNLRYLNRNRFTEEELVDEWLVVNWAREINLDDTFMAILGYNRNVD